VIDHIVYDSYGDILSETSPSNGDRFKFAGMEWDTAIQQYYDHARWYTAGVGRFAVEDPKWFAAGDDNLFRYVGSGPTDDVDPYGTNSEQAMTYAEYGIQAAATAASMAAGLKAGIVAAADVAAEAMAAVAAGTVVAYAALGAEVLYAGYLLQQLYQAHNDENQALQRTAALSQQIAAVQAAMALRVYAAKELEEQIQEAKDQLNSIRISMEIWKAMYTDDVPPEDPDDDNLAEQVQKLAYEAYQKLLEQREALFIKLSELMNQRGHAGPGGGQPVPGGGQPGPVG